MAKKKRQSRDQKRKEQLAKRAKRRKAHPVSLAYTGNRYKKDEYLPIVMLTEQGINQADVITDKRLMDKHVRAGLESLVLGLRAGNLPPLESPGSVKYVPGEEASLVALMIRINWADQFLGRQPPGDDVLIGICRTLLSSVETFTTPSPTSRGYLTFIAGFLKKGGAEARLLPGDAFSDDEFFEDEEVEDELVEIGEAWIEGEPGAREEFYAKARERVRAGQGESVVEAAQFLLGLAGTGAVMKELSLLSVTLQQGKMP